MLKIVVLGVEYFDDDAQEFVTVGDVNLELEHSLVSLSKWESQFEKPFLSKESKTTEELVAYIEAMTLTENVPGEIYQKLSEENLEAINSYIEAKKSATWFSEVAPEARSGETITSELVYYWMTSFSIPFECETWHLNRLFTLIRICGIKQSKPKKMSRSAIASRNRELNAQRRAKMGTTG